MGFERKKADPNNSNSSSESTVMDPQSSTADSILSALENFTSETGINARTKLTMNLRAKLSSQPEEEDDLDIAFIDYVAQLVFPSRQLALASKHNRFINHPISALLISRNIEAIVMILLEQSSMVTSEDVLDAHSIDGCLERIIRSQYRRHTDFYGYGNASQLLTRLRRIVEPKLLLSAINKYEFDQAMHFAYVMRRHLVPIVQLNDSSECLVMLIKLLWRTMIGVCQNTIQPVWEPKSDRPFIYSHIPQLHNVEWMAIAIDSLLVYFLRLLHHEITDRALDQQRRTIMFITCTRLLVHPFGIFIERYPQTLIDMVNHRQSVLSNVCNHLLSFLHLLIPNITEVLPELVNNEDSTFLPHKLYQCENSLLTYDDLPIYDELKDLGVSVALMTMGHCSFVMHMSTNIYKKIDPPQKHKMIQLDARMMAYMPHAMNCLNANNDTLILKSCQLIYELVGHVPPCSWPSEYFQNGGYEWIPNVLQALGGAVLRSKDMNLLKVIIPQLHDILTRLTYDGMVRSVEVLKSFQSCHATHFRTDTFVSCAFEHLCKRITQGLAPAARALTYCLIDCDPPLQHKAAKKFELNYLARCLCKTIKEMCALSDHFDANLLFHSKEQHKSVLQLLADLHNEAHGVGHLISLECASACDTYVEKLLTTINDAETTVTEYLAARDTFTVDKQLFCDHVVKRVHQLAAVKTFCLLVKKMRQLGHELRSA